MVSITPHPTCYLMCGIVASGKSAWVKARTSPCIIVSRDSLREMVHGGVYRYDRQIEGVLQDTVIGMTVSSLMRGFDVVVDECHLTKEKRKRTIEQLPHNTRVIIVYCPAIQGALERRMTDTRGISPEEWKKVIDSMTQAFEPPTKDEWGVDEVFINVI